MNTASPDPPQPAPSSLPSPEIDPVQAPDEMPPTDPLPPEPADDRPRDLSSPSD